MTKPLISVVVAAFNEEKCLPKCMEAITNQNFPKDEYEIIVVDNNSTDKTAEIAHRFGARVVTETKQGNTFAVKRGLDSATGEIIANTDADTVVFPDWLLTIKKIFADKNVVAATGSAYVKTGNRFLDYISRKTFDAFVAFNFLIGKTHITGFNMIVRKKTYDEIGGINEKFTMSPDVDLGLRLGKKGKVVFSTKLKALTSFRRWEETPLEAFWTYFKGYLWTVWFRKPPPAAQKPVR
jgi:glycosyltransferase involved in cell wall biosynthesis